MLHTQKSAFPCGAKAKGGVRVSLVELKAVCQLQASDNRDALARALYGIVFNFIAAP